MSSTLTSFTTSLRKLINVKNRIFKRFRLTRTADVQEKLAELSRLLEKQLREANDRVFVSLQGKLIANPKEVWKYGKLNKVDSVGSPDMTDGDTTLSEDAGKAACLNRYFQSVFSEPFQGAMPYTAPRY